MSGDQQRIGRLKRQAICNWSKLCCSRLRSSTISNLVVFTFSNCTNLNLNRHPDAYHTCYNMAGLSACQNYFQYQSSKSNINTSDSISALSMSEPKTHPPLTAAFHWKAQKTPFNGRKIGGRIFYETDRAGLINPVYVIPAGAAESARQWYEERPLEV
jgi:hypothetical protein